jgi:hypothetical protein
VLRLLHRRLAKAAQVLGPYLVLLAGQILAEGLVIQTRPLCSQPLWLRRWLALELLWSLNALQMLAFRWWPLAGLKGLL